MKAWQVFATVLTLAAGALNSQPLPSNGTAVFSLGAPVADFAVTGMDGQAFRSPLDVRCRTPSTIAATSSISISRGA